MQLLVSCLLLLFSKDTCDIVIAMFKALPIMLLKNKIFIRHHKRF